MSTETPEKSYYQAKREKLAAALLAWQEDPTGDCDRDGLTDASALEDFLQEQGLQILPTGPMYGGRYRVLVDGRPAPYIDQTRPSGPVDVDMAAEMFILAAQVAAKGDGDTQIVVRPATEGEQTRHAVLGDAVILPEPVEITADGYAIRGPKDGGGDSRVLAFTHSEGGTPARVRLGMELLRELSQSTSDEVREWDTANGGGAQ